MLKVRELLGRVGMPLSLGLAIVGQGILLADPCYKSGAPDVPCRSQGGQGCVVINPVPNLPCTGSWTQADAIDQGLNLTDPCKTVPVEHDTPKDGAVSGNEEKGHMNQGDSSWVCTSQRSCRKVFPPIVPVIVACVSPPLVSCTTITVFTAYGDPCPEGP